MATRTLPEDVPAVVDADDGRAGKRQRRDDGGHQPQSESERGADAAVGPELGDDASDCAAVAVATRSCPVSSTAATVFTGLAFTAAAGAAAFFAVDSHVLSALWHGWYP